MKYYWQLARTKVDAMSLREHVIIFLAAAFAVVALLNALLLDPLLVKQKKLSDQVVQQQNKIKELRTQIEAMLQAKRDDEHSPLRNRLVQIKQQLQEQDGYLLSLGNRLVDPNKMANLLEQVLNSKLQLVALKTLPVSLLIDKSQLLEAAGKSATAVNSGSPLIFKHGVQITVRGGYLDLLKYLAALEKMPAQMFWGEASLSMGQYPDAALTLTLYTLSLDKAWLAV